MGEVADLRQDTVYRWRFRFRFSASLRMTGMLPRRVIVRPPPGDYNTGGFLEPIAMSSTSQPPRINEPLSAAYPADTAVDLPDVKLPPPGKMTEEEFLAWYDEEHPAEWVNGEVIMMSPARPSTDSWVPGWSTF